MNDKKIAVVYRSKTGFTQRYAQQLAAALDCPALDWKDASPERLAGLDVVVFGTRAHAGRIDGLSKIRKRFAGSGAGKMVLFVTGAAPNEATDTISALWTKNLTAEEQNNLPHFYLQSGLCYEKMGLVDRMMMKGAAAFLAKKSEGNTDADTFREAISHSFDISSEEFLQPMLTYLQQ